MPRLVFNPFTGNFDFVNSQSSGSSGPSNQVIDNKEADQTLSALKVVKATSLTTIDLAEPDTYGNAQALGITKGVINSGNTGEIVTFGILEDASFNFPANEPLFLGVNGTITDTPPTTGFSLTIGHSLGAGAIFIDINEPINLC